MIKKMKKILGIILSVIMLCSTVTAFAQTSSDKVTVTMDGQEMEFDVQPIIENLHIVLGITQKCSWGCCK